MELKPLISFLCKREYDIEDNRELCVKFGLQQMLTYEKKKTTTTF